MSKTVAKAWGGGDLKGKVIGKAEVWFIVTLPTDYVHDPAADDDPVTECAMTMLDRMRMEISLNGPHRPPFTVLTDLDYGDVSIEEDGRL